MAKSENVTFWPTANSTIRGNIITPNEGDCPRPGVLFLHDYDSSRQRAVERAKSLIDSGVNIDALAIDLGGHGQSVVFDDVNKRQKQPRDKITIETQLKIIERSYEKLAKRPSVDAERIGIVGASFGGYLALLLATDGEYSVSSLMLRAPAIYPDGLELASPAEFPEDLDDFRTDLSAIKSSEAWKRIEGYKGPLWVIESGADESIPSTVMQAYATGAQNPTHLVIPGASHSLQNPDHKELYQSYLTDWAKDL